MLTRRITFRLYPSSSQELKLFGARRLHAYLYNGAVANRKTQYQKFNHSVDYFEQQASLPAFKEVWTEYKALNAGSLQATLKRVDFAFVRFFKGLGGYPKFRSIKNYSGWTYPDGRQGFKAQTNGKNGYLELTDLKIKIQMRGQARTWGKPTTCTIVYRSGKWYASITVKCTPLRETGNGAIGLDFGCKTAIADSNGNVIQPPKFLANAQKDIDRASKKLRRKRKPERRKRCTKLSGVNDPASLQAVGTRGIFNPQGNADRARERPKGLASRRAPRQCKASRRWKKAQKKISKLKKKVAQQRQNWVHHQAVEIVSSNSLIATEKLNLKGMTRKAKKGSKRKRQKTGLNRSILDVGIGMLKQAIAYKAKEAEAIYIEAPTRSLKPTQRCAKCWKLTKKDLSDRLHVCSNAKCNHTEDRDVNSAQVCLAWARGQELSSFKTADESSSTANPKVTHCGGFQQLAQVKRQKLMAQRSSHE